MCLKKQKQAYTVQSVELHFCHNFVITLSRECNKPQGETTCPSQAPVKGKITRNRGNIYHLAKSRNYDQTRPDICFKDEATAEKAGFRAPK